MHLEHVAAQVDNLLHGHDQIVSDAREGIWGMVQWGLSTLDFDYADYGTRHLARFMENCAAPSVAGWLENLQNEP